MLPQLPERLATMFKSAVWITRKQLVQHFNVVFRLLLLLVREDQKKKQKRKIAKLNTRNEAPLNWPCCCAVSC